MCNSASTGFFLFCCIILSLDIIVIWTIKDLISLHKKCALNRKGRILNVLIISCFSKSVDELLRNINGENLTSYTVTNINYCMEKVMLDSPKTASKDPWLIRQPTLPLWPLQRVHTLYRTFHVYFVHSTIINCFQSVSSCWKNETHNRVLMK